MSSKEMLEHLADMKIPAKSASSTLEDAYVSIVRKKLKPILEARAAEIEADEARPPPRRRPRRPERAAEQAEKERLEAERRREAERAEEERRRAAEEAARKKAEEERLAAEKAAAEEAERNRVKDTAPKATPVLQQPARPDRPAGDRS